MGWRLLLSLLLALTIVPEASIQTTTTVTSSTTAGSNATTSMMSSTADGSNATTAMMISTADGTNGTTVMMSSTADGSNATTAMMISTADGSNATTAMMNSTADGSNATTAMMNSTADGSNATTVMMSSTAAGSTASNPMVSSTAATPSTIATMRTTAARATATTAMMRTTAAIATATATTRGSTATATAVASTTTATGTTIPPALTFNSTVDRLPSPISNAGCSSSLLCAGEPESCNPSVAGSCFFVGTKRTAGQNFEFSLSGESDGYIGCTLSTDSSLGGGDITFICANNEGSLQFIGALLNNGSLTEEEVNANSVKGLINGTTIQCTFKATVPDTTSRTSATAFALAVVSGTFSHGELGAPKARVQTKVLDIADTNSSTVSVLTMTPPGTNSNSGRQTHQALSEALLIIIATMGLALL